MGLEADHKIVACLDREREASGYEWSGRTQTASYRPTHGGSAGCANPLFGGPLGLIQYVLVAEMLEFLSKQFHFVVAAVTA